jgi:3-oxoadipate enol-lactonase
MRAKINGFEMNFEVSGGEGKPAVVLHHPLATNLSGWDDLTKALEPNNRVVRFDARGHGASEAPKGPYTFEMLAGDVIALMDHLQIGKARYLGLSMGGFVGQYLGLLHANRFACLSLVSTSSRIPPEGQAMWDERIKNTLADGMKSQVEPALQRWLAPETRKSKPELVARCARMIEATPVAGYLGWAGAIRNLNITDRLKGIKLPTQVIVGALDPSTPPAAAQAIHKEIAGSSYVEMPGVSHMLHLEAPAEFHGHVLPFFAGHPAS